VPFLHAYCVEYEIPSSTFPSGPYCQKTNLTVFLKRSFIHLGRKVRIFKHPSSYPGSFSWDLNTLAGRDFPCKAGWHGQEDIGCARQPMLRTLQQTKIKTGTLVKVLPESLDEADLVSTANADQLLRYIPIESRSTEARGKSNSAYRKESIEGM
jgi:hypothetical protein